MSGRSTFFILGWLSSVAFNMALDLEWSWTVKVMILGVIVFVCVTLDILYARVEQ